MKPREYCCCAIPLLNVGIYATLTEQFALGVVVGTLSISAPQIVGAATPAVAPLILAIVSYVAAAVQLLGFWGVAKEKPITFRRYVTLHILSLFSVFSVAAVWIAMSAARHKVAQEKCESDFFSTPSGIAGSSEGQALCNIVPWVDVGIMLALWIFLAAAQFYFYLVVSSYASAQQRDHQNFELEYDALNLTIDIPMTHSRDNSGASNVYAHLRQDSRASVTSYIYGQYHERKPSDGVNGGYNQNMYPSHRRPPLPTTRYPPNAYTQDPMPTPRVAETYERERGRGLVDNVNRPRPIQVHPAEGSFRRKTPRFLKLNPEKYS